jgi:hypothetical protein
MRAHALPEDRGTDKAAAQAVRKKMSPYGSFWTVQAGNALNSLPVNGLQCIMERAMRWQRAARQMNHHNATRTRS